MLWRRDRLSALAVLAIPGVCLAIMLRQELFFARFALPLLPPLALLGGVGISGLADWAGRRPGPAVSVAMTLIVLALVLVPATLATVRHDQLASTTDTRILAQRWLEDRAGGARVVTEVYGLPISWTGTVPPHDYRLQRVASLVDPAGVRRLACDGVRYFVQASLTSEREERL